MQGAHGGAGGCCWSQPWWHPRTCTALNSPRLSIKGSIFFPRSPQHRLPARDLQSLPRRGLSKFYYSALPPLNQLAPVHPSPTNPLQQPLWGLRGSKKNTRRPSEEEGGGSEGSRGGGCPGEHPGPRPAAPSPVGIARFRAVGTRSPGAPCRGAGGGSQSFPPWVPKVDAAVPRSWAPPPIGKGCPRFAWPRAPRSLGRGRPVLPGSPRTQHPAAAATCRESPRSPAPLGVRCCSRSSAATRTSPKRRGAPGTRSLGAAPSLPTPSRCPPPSGPGPAPPAEG